MGVLTDPRPEHARTRGLAFGHARYARTRRFGKLGAASCLVVQVTFFSALFKARRSAGIAPRAGGLRYRPRNGVRPESKGRTGGHVGRRQDPGGAAREDQVESARVESARVETTRVRTAKAGFTDLVLVCRKCAKRQGVDRKQLGRAVKRAFRQGARGEGSGKGAGKVRVLETGCLGPCPKRMLTLATPDSLARRRVILVDPALDTIGPAALTLAAVVPSPAAPIVVFTASETSPAAPADGAGNG
jgi:hypothetical protein